MLGIAVGPLIIGAPLVLPLAVLAFLGGFVPVVDAPVAGSLAALVALVSGGPVDALLTLGAVIVVQQVDSNALRPVAMGHEVPLHPVVLLVAVTAGAVLAGILGAVPAVPRAAVISAIGNELRLMDVGTASAREGAGRHRPVAGNLGHSRPATRVA